MKPLNLLYDSFSKLSLCRFQMQCPVSAGNIENILQHLIVGQGETFIACLGCKYCFLLNDSWRREVAA